MSYWTNILTAREDEANHYLSQYNEVYWEWHNTKFLMYPYCTGALCVLFKWLSFNTRCSLFVLYCSYNIRCSKAEFSFRMTETIALSFTLSIDSPLTYYFQHFGIYIKAIRTSTRGLWTPIKLYFVQSSKWSDHKPSNRGINSQYWPVFQLRPASMASSQNFEDRPPAQTFARLEKQMKPGAYSYPTNVKKF